MYIPGKWETFELFTVSIPCNVTNYTPTNFTWEWRRQDDPGEVISNSMYLTIASVANTDSGVYQCQVFNNDVSNPRTGSGQTELIVYCE